MKQFSQQNWDSIKEHITRGRQIFLTWRHFRDIKATLDSVIYTLQLFVTSTVEKPEKNLIYFLSNYGEFISQVEYL
jgi:hypothetical protein